MRKHTAVLAVLLVTAGCGGHTDTGEPARRTVATAKPAAPALPAASGTVNDKRTSLLVRIASLKTAKSFSDGRKPQKATKGDTLIVVKLRITNTGKTRSALEADDPHPVSLVSTGGSTYGTELSWASAQDIAPGNSRTEPYVFDVPAGEKAASVTVSVPDAQGNLSIVHLKAP